MHYLFEPPTHNKRQEARANNGPVPNLIIRLVLRLPRNQQRGKPAAEMLVRTLLVELYPLGCIPTQSDAMSIIPFLVMLLLYPLSFMTDLLVYSRKRRRRMLLLCGHGQRAVEERLLSALKCPWRRPFVRHVTRHMLRRGR
ncbi:hypothetical protein Cni_G05097 [Canna indica]|uniref:Uncharacterized protein n=1 Tax=Canna indica TaxID=4628 RepID=A0AAQ3Q2W4_9LILI|nr:hypothetical protein Cni_G05097 [Canna indica]